MLVLVTFKVTRGHMQMEIFGSTSQVTFYMPQYMNIGRPTLFVYSRAYGVKTVGVQRILCYTGVLIPHGGILCGLRQITLAVCLVMHTRVLYYLYEGVMERKK